MFCCIAEQLIDFCGGQGVFQNAAKHNRDWTAVHKLLKDRLEHDTRPPCEFAQRSRYSQFMARSCHLQRAAIGGKGQMRRPGAPPGLVLAPIRGDRRVTMEVLCCADPDLWEARGATPGPTRRRLS